MLNAITTEKSVNVAVTCGDAASCAAVKKAQYSELLKKETLGEEMRKSAQRLMEKSGAASKKNVYTVTDDKRCAVHIRILGR